MEGLGGRVGLGFEGGLSRYSQLLARAIALLGLTAEALLHPLFVLPAIVVAASNATTAIGVLTAVVLVAWLLPQLVIEPGLWRGALVRLYGGLLGLRAGLALLVGLALLLLSGSPGALLGLLLFLLAGFWAVGGVLATGGPGALLPESELEAEASPERRLVWASGLAVLAGLLIARLLGPEGFSFPGWAVVLALLMALLLVVGALLTWRLEQVTEGSGAAWPALGLALPLVLHGLRLRRYLFFRAVLSLAALADPFIIVYGLRAFGLPWQGVGIYLALFALVTMVARLFGPGLVAAGQARVIGQAAALARVLAPLLALSLPLILQSGPVSRLIVGLPWAAPLLFGGVIVLYALAVAGVEATDAAYLREALAPGHRPAARALLIVLLVACSLAYVVGGSLIERWGYTGLLLTAVGVGLVGILASGLLLEVPPATTRELTATGALPTYREQND